MTKLLEQVLQDANTLPEDAQKELAEKWQREIDFRHGRWNEDQLASIRRGQEDVRAGRITTEADKEALRAKYPTS